MNIKKKELDTLLINANRIFSYRKDLLEESELLLLNDTRERLQYLIRNFKSINEDLNNQNELNQINKFLLKIGGKIYPKTFWIDNVEVGLVALVIIIGIRTFFFQPFIIPTNSMYPTYSGMNEVIYELDEEKPSIVENFFNKVLLGSKNFHLESNNNGEVSVSIFSQAKFSLDSKLRSTGFISFKYVNGRKWFGLLPAKYREYQLFVNNKPIKIQVPFDYSLDNVILKPTFRNMIHYRML